VKIKFICFNDILLFPAGIRDFFFLLKRIDTGCRNYPVSHSVGTGCTFPRVKSTDLYLVMRLRVSGVVTSFPPNVVIVCTGTTLLLTSVFLCISIAHPKSVFSKQNRAFILEMIV
jgi:hypothetical protein